MRSDPTELKNRGNALFAEGKIEEAVACYKSALSLSSLDAGSSSSSELLAARSVIASNLSHALWTIHRFDESADAAKEATRADPTNVKAWCRLLRALASSERYMEALLVYRGEGRKYLLDTRDRTVLDLLGDLPNHIHEKLGLRDMINGFALQALTTSSGVTSSCTESVGAQKVLFVEEQWRHPLLQTLVAADGETVSAERLIVHFAKQLRAMQRNEPDAWKTVTLAMRGSWPRCHSDIPAEQRQVTEALLALLFAKDDVQPTSDELEQLVLLSLVCRYNCFQSGFFRACALINHSCSPNVAMKFVARTQSVHLLAVQPIHKGDTLSVKYLSDGNYLEGVGVRRQLLHSSWLFWCDCSRCKKDLTQCAQTDSSSTAPLLPQERFTESKKCRACDGYVHCPCPGRPEGGDTAEDPLLAHFTATCPTCQAECQWTADELSTLYSARDDAIALLTAPSLRIQDLSIRFSECRGRVQNLVHPEHWIHRVLLYYFSLPTAQILGQVFQNLFQSESDNSLSEAAAMFLRQFGGARDGGRNGGDALACLRELWRLIEPFYPWGEGWALHCAICRLTLFSICLPDAPAALDINQAVTVFGLHAPHVGQQERSAYSRFLQRWKPNDKGPHAISPKHMKMLKKALEN